MAYRKTWYDKLQNNDAVVRCASGECEPENIKRSDGESWNTHCVYCGRVIEEDE